VTASRKETARILEAIEWDYDEIRIQKRIEDAQTILEQVKHKGKPNGTKRSKKKPTIQPYSA
jgi:hypothetical protein